MFRVLQSGNGIPYSFICDPSAEFEAGMIGQLTTNGNQVVCGVSDGLCPIGVIDDMRTRSFSAPSWNEIVLVAATGVESNGKIVSVADVKIELNNPNVVASSFTSSVSCVLNARNGVITFPAGTELNFSTTDNGVPDAIRAIVNYRYQVANIAGDDSTAGSGQITIWYERFIGETDMFETNQTYPLNANLFVSENGLLTTRQVTTKHPAVALVISPPSPVFGSLQFLWL